MKLHNQLFAQKRYAFLALFIAVVFLSLFNFLYTEKTPFYSSEVGVATYSKTNPGGALAVPASCPAFAHTIGECDPSVTLTVNNLESVTVNAGDPLTFRWLNNPNTYGCTAVSSSGNVWTGAKTPATTAQLSQPATAPTSGGPYTYTLNCRGASLGEALNIINEATPFDDPPPLSQTAYDSYYHQGITAASSLVPAEDAYQYLNRIHTRPHSVMAADIVVGTDNIPRIAYYNYPMGVVFLYTCSDANCTGEGSTVALASVNDFVAYGSGSSPNPRPALIDITLQAGNIPRVVLTTVSSDPTYWYIERIRTITCADSPCSSKTEVSTRGGLSASATPVNNYYAIMGAEFFGRPLTYGDNPGTIGMFGWTGGGIPTSNYAFATRPNGQKVYLRPHVEGTGEGLWGIGGEVGGLYGLPSYFLQGEFPWGLTPNDDTVGFRFSCQDDTCAERNVVPSLVWDGREVSDSVTVTVNAAPPPTPTTPTASCVATSGTTASMTINWTGVTPVDYYQVRIDGNLVGGNRPTSPTSYTHNGLTQGTTHTATVSACNSAGVCRTSAPTGNVNCLYPPVTASCSVSPTTAVLGQPVTWTAVGTGGTGTYTYSWTGSEDLTGAGRTVNKTYTTTGPKTASVTITSGSGVFLRSSGLVSCSNSATITGQPDLTATLNSPLNNAVVSAGQPLSLAGVIRNIGNVVPGQASTAYFQIDRNDDGDFTDAVDVQISATPLAGANLTALTDTTNVTASWTTPAPPRSFGVRLCADYPLPGIISESNEANNCSARRAFTTSSSLTVSCIPSPISIEVGQTTDVTWTATPSEGPSSSYWYIWDSDPNCDPSSGPTRTCEYFPATTGQIPQSVEIWNFGVSASCTTLTVTTGTGGGAPDIAVDLIVTPRTVSNGDSVNISWDTSGGSDTPDSCTATSLPSLAGWGGGVDPSGGSRSNIGPLTVPGRSYWFHIVCQKGSASTSDTEVVVVSSGTGGMCGNSVVDAGEDCDEGSLNGTTGSFCSTSCRARSCNFNRICQPLRGETPLNCSDCSRDIEEQ